MEMEALVSNGVKEEEELSFFRGRGGELGGFSCSQGSLSWRTKKGNEGGEEVRFYQGIRMG